MSSDTVGEDSPVERQRLVVQTLVELADASAVGYDVVETLYVLTERCVRMFDAEAAGALLRDPTRGLTVTAGSSHPMRALAVFEAEEAEGPAWQAYASGRPVTVADLSGARRRWPSFAPKALELGFQRVHAEPLRLREHRIGALEIHRSGGRPFDGDDRFVAAGLATMTAIAVLHARDHGDADEQIRQLRSALDNRAVVEQAKALLAERLGTDVETAFDWLRRYARSRNRRLRDVAQQVLDGRITAAAIAGDERP